MNDGKRSQPIFRWAFLLHGRKEENMKQFNQAKVQKIAIDRSHHQQLYVSDKDHRDAIFKVLFEMGFTTDLNQYTGRYATTPIVINTLEHTFHPATPGLMPFAITGGAKILNYLQFLNLLEDVHVM